MTSTHQPAIAGGGESESESEDTSVLVYTSPQLQVVDEEDDEEGGCVRHRPAIASKG